MEKKCHDCGLDLSKSPTRRRIEVPDSYGSVINEIYVCDNCYLIRQQKNQRISKIISLSLGALGVFTFIAAKEISVEANTSLFLFQIAGLFLIGLAFAEKYRSSSK